MDDSLPLSRPEVQIRGLVCGYSHKIRKRP